jgi:ribosomal protein S18 acetylase RimI-like enzyme
LAGSFAATHAAAPRRRRAPESCNDRSVRLRPATPGDAPRLRTLAEAAYGRYVERLGAPPRPMTDDYADVVWNHRVTVAERDGEIVGLIVLAVTDEGFAVDNVAVDPLHQGSGVGRALLEHAEGEARRAGFDSIYLYTHERMTENLALYSRIGYAEYDRRLHGDACLVYLRKPLG